MAFCPNCGTPNTEQAEKCTACGFDLAVPKQKAKFKGTIMMSGIKAPTADAPKEDGGGIGDQPTEPPPPKPSLPPPAAAALAKPGDSGRSPNFQKTMMGHAAILAPAAPAPAPAKEDSTEPVELIEAASPPPTPPPAPAVPPPPTPASSSVEPMAQTIAESPRPSAPTAPATSGLNGPANAGPANSAWTGTNAPRRAGAGGYESTLPPTAPEAPKPGKVLAIGCAVALAFFLIVGGGIFYLVRSKLSSWSGEEDPKVEALAWQASIIQSLVQVSELCRSDCDAAGVYFHPLKQAALLSEAKSLSPDRVTKLSDPVHAVASMLNGTEDEGVATKLGLDPHQCARVINGKAKVISCSVPDVNGKPSVLRIVDLSGVSSL